MSPQEIGFLGIAVLLVLLVLGCPVGIAMMPYPVIMMTAAST